jgi:redox-sensing transcriptional repressor
MTKNTPSKAMIARLSRYLRGLEGAIANGTLTINSKLLGELLGISDSQVRKDFAMFNRLGHPGIGYRCEELAAVIRETLGMNRSWRVVMVGCGNLGQALIGYPGFRQRGMTIDSAFDQNPQLVGKKVGDLTIDHFDNFAAVVGQKGIRLAILAVPAAIAQNTAEIMAKAGILGILNFAPVNLNLPSSVSTANVDLTIELEQLVFAVVQNRQLD